LGFVVQLWLGVQAPQVPFPSQTMLVPQLVPPVLLLPSAQVIAPVMQEFVPFLQMLGLPAQEPPAVQGTQVPFPSQTMLVPQLVPPILLPPSAQVIAPLMQEFVPFLQMLGLPVQEPPAVQGTQVPFPSQTRLAPQLVPGALLPPSTQVMAPVMQDVVPFLQAVGLVEQLLPAVQAIQLPAPLQTMPLPQPMPGALLPPSTQVMAPVMQEFVPFLQTLGLLVHPVPDVHEMHVPEPLQTMLVPQVVPPVFGVPFTHIEEPVMHEATPL